MATPSHREPVETLRGLAGDIVRGTVRVIGEDRQVVGGLLQSGNRLLVGVGRVAVAVAQPRGLVRHPQAIARTWHIYAGRGVLTSDIVVIQTVIESIVVQEEAVRPRLLDASVPRTEHSDRLKRREREIHVDLVVHGLRQVVRDPVRPAVALHVFEARVTGRRSGENVVLGRKDGLARMRRPDQGTHAGESVLVVIPQFVVDLVVHALQQGIARGRVRDRQDGTRLRNALARELGRHGRGEGRDLPAWPRFERAGAERRQHAAIHGIRQGHHAVRTHGHEVAHEHAVAPDLERMEAMVAEVPRILKYAVVVIT